MALLESHEIASLVVGFAVEPATMKDADPLEGESTKRCLMGAAAFAVALVEVLGPVGARDGLAHPFDEGLALKGGARKAPVDPELVATAVRRPRTSGGRERRGIARVVHRKAASRRGARAGPAPGRESKSA
jgi:hypothetical protein